MRTWLLLACALSVAAYGCSPEPPTPPPKIVSASLQGKEVVVRFDRKLERGTYYYSIDISTKSGFAVRGTGVLTSINHFFDPGPSYRVVNVMLFHRRHDPPKKRERLEAEVVPGNIRQLVIRIATGYGPDYVEEDKIVEARFTNL